MFKDILDSEWAKRQGVPTIILLVVIVLAGIDHLYLRPATEAEIRQQIADSETAHRDHLKLVASEHTKQVMAILAAIKDVDTTTKMMRDGDVRRDERDEKNWDRVFERLRRNGPLIIGEDQP